VTFRVVAVQAGQRLDKLVVEHLGALGRRRASVLFSEARVRVGGRAARKGERAREGDEVSVILAREEGYAEESAAVLSVRAESEHWVVVSKLGGQPCVALTASETGTLAGALVAHYPEMATLGTRGEAGLVHRIDTGTSGLLVAARTSHAHARMRSAVRNAEFDKRYLAIVPQRDLPGSGLIDDPLEPHARDRRRVVVRRELDPESTLRTTAWRVLRRGPTWALLEVSVSRAYRHQIRVHLAAIGHPIAGDPLYGGLPAVPGLGPGRHALHASHVAWAGDAELAGFAVDEDLPVDMLELLEL
jgi:23S rRNA pseudouridine1911/1915/1917 synthase